MKNPKVGERVAVYGYTQPGSYIVMCGAKGTIGEVRDRNWLTVKIDGKGDYIFHHKQCRRLMKKERRRVWINEYSNGLNQAWHSSAEEVRLNQVPGCTLICCEFVEVKRKK